MLKNLKPTVLYTNLKNHKKKSIFLAGLLGYFAYYSENKRKQTKLFTNYCRISKAFGDEPVTVSPCKKITVLLNEFAKHGKCKYDFEKYALPMLHLAGLEVEIIKPQDEQQLFNIASILDRQETDIVYVVGGDGTVAKVVNGMMSQLKNNGKNNKNSKNSNNLPPLAVFPGGLENFFVKQIFPQDKSSVKWYCDNALAIIKGHFENRSVIEVEIDDKNSFFAAQLLHLGSFLEAEEKKFAYWYMGRLKRSFSYVWQALRNKPESYDITVQYVEPCSGCSKCYKEKRRQIEQQQQHQQNSTNQRRWWHSFIGQPQKVVSNEEIEYSNIVNEKCGHVIEDRVQSVEVFATNDKNEHFKNLLIDFGPESISRFEFISEGMKRNQHKENGFTPSVNFACKFFKAREMTINLNYRSDEEEKSPKKIGIDGNMYEFVDRIKLKVVPNALKYFCYE